MANTPAFLDHLRELLRAAGVPATTRAMFGGHGLYADGAFFGIVDDDVLYLRVDDGNRGAFSTIGAAPFEYMTKDGRRQAMGYLRAPDEALERADAMGEWARSSIGAALRAAASKRKPAPRPRPRRASRA